MQEHITQRSKGSLKELMKEVVANREVRVAYHAVGLTNTGKTAEGQQDQHDIGKTLTITVNTTGDLQYAVIKTEQCGRKLRKRHKKDIEQIEKYHITSQFCDAQKP